LKQAEQQVRSALVAGAQPPAAGLNALRQSYTRRNHIDCQAVIARLHVRVLGSPYLWEASSRAHRLHQDRGARNCAESTERLAPAGAEDADDLGADAP
jgi:hypothetical protein